MTNLTDLSLTSTLAVTGLTTLTGGFAVPVTVMTADGACSAKSGLVILNKAGVLAATLADPTATTDDGKILHFVSITAQAHTVTIAGGLNGVGAGADVGTFAAAIGNGFSCIAYNGKWYLLSANTNVTFA